MMMTSTFVEQIEEEDKAGKGHQLHCTANGIRAFISLDPAMSIISTRMIKGSQQPRVDRSRRVYDAMLSRASICSKSVSSFPLPLSSYMAGSDLAALSSHDDISDQRNEINKGVASGRAVFCAPACLGTGAVWRSMPE